MEAAPDDVSWAEVCVSPSLLYLWGQCCVAKDDVYTMVQTGESFRFPGLTTVLPDVPVYVQNVISSQSLTRRRGRNRNRASAEVA